ncbi:MAG: FkbM family methyltransferase [Candidatus Brocadiia bacterium]
MLFTKLLTRGTGYALREVCGSTLCLKPGETVSDTLLRFGVREPQFTRLVAAEIGEGMNVLEIGANIGHVTCMLARLVGENGAVLAVEPVPANLRLLRANISLNGYSQVKVYWFSVNWTVASSI